MRRLDCHDRIKQVKSSYQTALQTVTVLIGFVENQPRLLGDHNLNLSEMRALVAELHDVVSSAVPEGALGFRSALHHTFEGVLSHADHERYSLSETERMLFVLPRLVESLVHGAAHQTRAALSRSDAWNEAIRTVLVYVNSCQGSATKHY